MTRQELLAEIDAATQSRLAVWQPIQEQYRAQHGRYMQVLCTHSVYPADGNATVPDRIAEAPYYQQESLSAMGFTADPLTAAFAVDQCSGPDGNGWTLRVMVVWQGVTWAKTHAFGSGTTAHDWREVEEG